MDTKYFDPDKTEISIGGLTITDISGFEKIKIDEKGYPLKILGSDYNGFHYELLLPFKTKKARKKWATKLQEEDCISITTETMYLSISNLKIEEFE